ncbi:polysaccharide pyruvyl transferase [Dyadobacter jejuensis]|uniref:Polysaccharide pyruvyl transferase n=1 Tax=Dyadobacter jejuensis TaxID=1082580 RepID=A0A316AF45_9BACT|nr:polysaccharide pyruvyl transferase family protein [Dyadobacter jejuensis]PWJ55989.1 polysaccharide pyruvyl transferase [Dyadobacter jejuensis]
MATKVFQKIYRNLINKYTLFTRFQIWRTKSKYPVKIIRNTSTLNHPSIHFIHRYCTNNTGDIACGYYQYINRIFAEYACLVHDINSVKFSLIKKNDIIVIGGGGLLNASTLWNYNIKKSAKLASKSIIWTAGFNSSINNESVVKLEWEDFDLISVRDYEYQNFRFVPCATCMLHELELEYPSIRKIGVIAHKDVLNHLPDDLKHFDFITNNAPLSKMIEFIGTSDIIVTNSYHAVYWSTLMQKKCILFAPRSEKYNYFKYPPVLYSGDLEFDISQAQIYPNSLDICRKLNMEYINDMKDLIS